MATSRFPQHALNGTDKALRKRTKVSSAGMELANCPRGVPGRLHWSGIYDICFTASLERERILTMAGARSRWPN